MTDPATPIGSGVGSGREGEDSTSAAEAATLLLRSPRWSVSDVMELLEIGDVEFRRLVECDRRLARVLEARKTDQSFNGVTERQCKACGELYRTATFRAYCGAPACRAVEQIEKTR